ncbi:MAG TPA: glycine dehydrogenase, partial [Roseiarcus sp.]|nr:glycine dehydrogenase [Roseiarcus sp.]
IHLSLLGEAGLRRLANLNHAGAVELADRLSDVKGADVLNKTFFNEFTIRLRRPAARIVEELARRGVIGGLPVSRLLPKAGLDDLMIVANTETDSPADRAAFAAALAEVLAASAAS